MQAKICSVWLELKEHGQDTENRGNTVNCIVEYVISFFLSVRHKKSGDRVRVCDETETRCDFTRGFVACCPRHCVKVLEGTSMY